MFSRFFTVAAFALEMHALRWWREYVLSAGILGILCLMLGTFLLSSPRQFPVDETITITKGASLAQIARELAEARAIRSPSMFRLTTYLLGGSRDIHAGLYQFDTRLGVIGIALRLIRGDSNIPPARITFPEGITVREMARLFGDAFDDEFRRGFLEEAKPHEGYLFPDTYLFSSQDTPESVVKHMRDIFDARTALLTSAFNSSGRSLDEVVTMASLIEREANTDVDRKMIAGILWKRVDIGMPLQVDAVFAYIKGVNAYAPNFDDLKIESPYNTYLYKGLPPTPIGNPGMKALEAALTPTKTNYLYYLTGSDGKMRYAVTFPEHQTNRAKYLQ